MVEPTPDAEIRVALAQRQRLDWRVVHVQNEAVIAIEVAARVAPQSKRGALGCVRAQPRLREEAHGRGVAARGAVDAVGEDLDVVRVRGRVQPHVARELHAGAVEPLKREDQRRGSCV